jgi:hypothetical protein
MSDGEKEEAPEEGGEKYCDVHSVFYTTQCGVCSDEAVLEFGAEAEGIPAGGIFDTPGGGENPRLVITPFYVRGGARELRGGALTIAIDRRERDEPLDKDGEVLLLVKVLQWLTK